MSAARREKAGMAASFPVKEVFAHRSKIRLHYLIHRFNAMFFFKPHNESPNIFPLKNRCHSYSGQYSRVRNKSFIIEGY